MLLQCASGQATPSTDTSSTRSSLGAGSAQSKAGADTTASEKEAEKVTGY